MFSFNPHLLVRASPDSELCHHQNLDYGPIRLLPTTGGLLQAELRHNAEGLITLALGDALKVRMVAGARFELTTFRL